MKKKSGANYFASFFTIFMVILIVTILVVSINPISTLMAQEGAKEGAIDTRGAEKGLIKGGVGVGIGADGQGYLFVINIATQWFDTGIDIKEGEKITITASPSKTDPPCDGRVGCPPYRSPADVIKDGFAGSGFKALVGKLSTEPKGEDTSEKVDETTFSVGGELVHIATKSGRLYLGYNDCARCFSDNTGAFEVTVSIEKP